MVGECEPRSLESSLGVDGLAPGIVEGEMTAGDGLARRLRRASGP